MKSFYKKEEYNEYKIHQTRKWGAKANKQRGFQEYKSIFDNVKNLEKFKNIFIESKNIEMICLGARNPHEKNSFRQLFLDEKINVDVFSLDIAESAAVDYHYDFGDMPKDWTERFSVIYTNAPDHAFDFSQCLSEWKRVLKPGGVCIIGISDINIATTNTNSNNLNPEDCTLFESKDEIKNMMESNFSSVSYFERDCVSKNIKRMNYNYWICFK